MRIVIAPQSLKGSLTAIETGQAIAQGVRNVYPTAEVVVVPIADGGEGTAQALVDATGGELRTQIVTGPLGEPVLASFGLLGDGKTAVIEMATCAGLPLLSADQRDPRLTTTYGVGELISAALDLGRRRFIVGIGGSATNDGGAGMAQALGATLMRSDGTAIARGGTALATLASVDITTLDSRLHECSFEVACDVTNPLCGPLGASAIYGPQKGATPAMVVELDTALLHYAQIIERDLHKTVAEVAGGGAAGGMGAGLLAFLEASLRPGAEIVLEMLRLEELIRDADLLITAEGQLDAQTAYGKCVGAVAALARRYSVPVLALAGGLGENYQLAYDLGITAVMVLPSRPLSLVYAMEHAAILTVDATERALRLIKLGATMRRSDETRMLSDR